MAGTARFYKPLFWVSQALVGRSKWPPAITGLTALDLCVGFGDPQVM